MYVLNHLKNLRALATFEILLDKVAELAERSATTMIPVMQAPRFAQHLRAPASDEVAPAFGLLWQTHA